VKKIKKEKPFVWVDWDDGVKLKIKLVHFNVLAERYPELFDPKAELKYKNIRLSIALYREGLIGWNDQIQGEDGKILPFNEHTRSKILDEILSSGTEIQSKIVIALKGSLGNLIAGLTASSNGNGTSESVAGASKKTGDTPAKTGAGASTS